MKKIKNIGDSFYRGFDANGDMIVIAPGQTVEVSDSKALQLAVDFANQFEELKSDKPLPPEAQVWKEAGEKRKAAKSGVTNKSPQGK